jgi:hypothetical protein
MEERKKTGTDEENLQMENQFLKMKLMLEHGASFGSSDDLPAAVENDFLRSVMEFEKQWATGERISVFDKLGKPNQFKPVNEIADADIDQEWIRLFEFMQERGIDVSVCSPNVNARELYRFTLEELFEAETDNICMPGMMTCFIYDEFHPDEKYDNARVAVEDCIHYFFDQEFFNEHHFAESIQVNQHRNLTKDELKFIVQNFKNQYDEIVPSQIVSTGCLINNNRCVVHGKYEAAMVVKGNTKVKKGYWTVEFFRDEQLGYWYIHYVQIRGMSIP